MTVYRACGLRFDSDFDLSPLPRARGAGDQDVMVKRGKVSPQGIKDPVVNRPLAQIGKGCVWLDIPDIARFQIDGGRRIQVDPYPGAEERSIMLFLLGSALGALLHQRGFLTLHANAVKVGDGAVLFSGVSGAGKSTAAMAMLERGYDVLADDVTAINDAGDFAGGIPRLKLWKDVLGKMDITLEGLERIRLEIDKYHLPLPAAAAKKPLPVRAIYILRSANEMDPGKFELERLEGRSKFLALRGHTYRPHYMQGLGLKPKHLTLCGALAARAAMARIVRPTARFNAPELAERVLEDLREQKLLGESG